MPVESSQLENENRRLRRAVEELSVLNEVASAVRSTLSLDGIVETIVEACVRNIGVAQGVVMLLSEEADHPFQTMVRKVDSVEEVLPHRLGDQLAGWMLKNRSPLMINDPERDARIRVSGAKPGEIRSLLSVPMIVKGRLIGLLNVFDKKDPNGFTMEDQRLLAIIATQSAQVIQNARLFQNLEEAHRELEGYSKSLEEKVAERTGELREKNEALESANRQVQVATERKSAFLASMSHELRTPMNAIIGFTRMVLRRTGDVLPERQKENLDKVMQSANHLLTLINDILDLSKIEAGRMDLSIEVFNARTLIAGCCAEVEPLVTEKPEVTLTYDVQDDIGEANTDSGRLRQILMNLLSNAIKFTEKGEVAVRGSRAGNQLVLAVSDTGAGIPAEARETIFEEFRQVEGSDPQHKGTGLGLPICKGFAELLGGSITVESEVRVGSTFTVRVPVVYGEG